MLSFPGRPHEASKYPPERYHASFHEGRQGAAAARLSRVTGSGKRRLARVAWRRMGLGVYNAIQRNILFFVIFRRHVRLPALEENLSGNDR
jgi:hypothetical protein